MKRIFCDVCNEEITAEQRPIYTEPSYKTLLEICDIYDVCPRCANIGRKIDIQFILLDDWRDAVKTRKVSE